MRRSKSCFDDKMSCIVIVLVFKNMSKVLNINSLFFNKKNICWRNYYSIGRLLFRGRKCDKIVIDIDGDMILLLDKLHIPQLTAWKSYLEINVRFSFIQA